MTPSTHAGRPPSTDGTRPPLDEDRRWRALGDPTRRAILDVLRAAPATTGDIAGRFPISRIAIMRHLGVLADAGLVTSRKRGRQRWHYVNLAPLMTLHERWSTPLSETLAAGVLGLRRTLERPVGELSSIDIRIEVDIGRDRATVFRAITETPGAWWGHPFLRADADALTIDSGMGGRLVEHWPGGSMIMATVTGRTTDRWFQLSGPFHLGAALAVAEFDLTDSDDGCRLTLSFRGSGLLDEVVADGFEAGWHELVTIRLKTFVEDGLRLGIDQGG